MHDSSEEGISAMTAPLRTDGMGAAGVVSIAGPSLQLKDQRELGGDRCLGAAEEFTETVLAIVDRIPPGRVMTYGDIAEYAQHGGPRGVGGVMARDGAAVTWWRVVRVDGTLPPHLMIEAQTQWLHEGTPLRRGIVDIPAARWWPGPVGATDVGRRPTGPRS